MAGVLYKPRTSGEYTVVAVDTDNVYLDSAPTQGINITLPSYTISYSLTGISVVGEAPTSIEYEASFRLKAKSGYALPQEIEVVGVETSTYNNQTGDVFLQSPTSNVEIIAVATVTTKAIKIDVPDNKKKKRYGFFV